MNSRLQILNAFLTAVVLSAFVLILIQDRQLLMLGEDSRQYLEFASAIQSHHFLERRSVSDLAEGNIIRTPGFPFVIVLASQLPGNDLLRRIRLVHTLALSFAAICICFSLRGILPSSVSSFLVLLPVWHMRWNHNSILSEWTSFCVVLTILAALICVFRYKNTRSCLFLSLVSAVAPLVHPSLIAASLFTASLTLYLARSSLKSSLAVFLGYSPLYLWCLINFLRLGSFTLTAHSATSLFMIASLFGPVASLPGDSPELKSFITHANEISIPAQKAEIETAKHLVGADNLGKIYRNNGYSAVKYLREQGYDISTRSKLLRSYAMRGLLTHAREFISYLGLSLHALSRSLFLLPITLGLPLYLILRERYTAIAQAALVFTGYHLLHSLSLIAITPLFSRYYSTSFYPYLLSATLLIAVFAKIVLAKNTEAPC